MVVSLGMMLSKNKAVVKRVSGVFFLNPKGSLLESLRFPVGVPRDPFLESLGRPQLKSGLEGLSVVLNGSLRCFFFISVFFVFFFLE